MENEPITFLTVEAADFPASLADPFPIEFAPNGTAVFFCSFMKRATFHSQSLWLTNRIDECQQLEPINLTLCVVVSIAVHSASVMSVGGGGGVKMETECIHYSHHCH
ncbi:hypothetical protein T08_2555 [Trichinella sp. T8]|nr:hypothetical protein T08_2555 [Trichinella sp. T8]